MIDRLSMLVPPVLRIEPASACNFKCRHCPTGLGMNGNTGIMSEDVFKTIYAKIRKYRFRVIVLYHGGEPLLNPHFFEMVRLLKPLAERVETVTNGSLLTDHKINKVVKSGIHRIKISFDGNSIEENNKIRVNANGARILEKIKMLIQAKNRLESATPRIIIASVIIPKTIKETATLPQPPKHIVDFLGDLNQHVEYLTAYSLVWPGLSPLIRLKHPESINNRCDHVINTTTIRWDGTVVPCCYDLTTLSPMGNMLEQYLEDIWDNEKYKKLREDILSFNLPPLCHGCLVFYPQNYITRQDIQL